MYYIVKLEDKINKTFISKKDLDNYLIRLKIDMPNIYKNINVSKITQNFKIKIKIK